MISSSLSMQPFELQPSVFELRHGEAFVLECIFKPPDDRRYEQDIVMTCDNCTALEFKLVGQGELARVEYVELDASALDSQNPNSVPVDEFKDVSSSKVIRFEHLNPNVFERKKFAIKNVS